jgi:hypothetical protein
MSLTTFFECKDGFVMELYRAVGAVAIVKMLQPPLCITVLARGSRALFC